MIPEKAGPELCLLQKVGTMKEFTCSHKDTQCYQGELSFPIIQIAMTKWKF